MNYDYLPDTPYEIIHSNDLFHMTTDAVQLGRFIKILHKDHVLDIGCNTGILMLYSAKYQPQRLVGIDIHEDAIEEAKQNMAHNNIVAEFIHMPIQDYHEFGYTVLICNPPYFEPTDMNQSGVSSRNIKEARNQSQMTLTDLFDACKRLLKSDGRLYMVYRANRIMDVLSEGLRVGMRASKIQYVHANEQKAAKTVLLEMVFRPRTDTVIEPPIIMQHKEICCGMEAKNEEN